MSCGQLTVLKSDTRFDVTVFSGMSLFVVFIHAFSTQNALLSPPRAQDYAALSSNGLFCFS